MNDDHSSNTLNEMNNEFAALKGMMQGDYLTREEMRGIVQMVLRGYTAYRWGVTRSWLANRIVKPAVESTTLDDEGKANLFSYLVEE